MCRTRDRPQGGFKTKIVEDAMHRRSMLWAAVSAFGAVFAASRPSAATATPSASKLKVAYHLL
jgi:hypothetical protein